MTKRSSRRVVLALMLTPLLVAGALFEHLAFTRQRLQTKVDSAAQRGAEAIFEGHDPKPVAVARLRRFSALGDGDTAIVEWPPRDGPYGGKMGVVRVRLHTQWRPPLLSALLPSRLRLEIRAAAAVVPGTARQGRPHAIRVE
jgi:hypothetical protein